MKDVFEIPSAIFVLFKTEDVIKTSLGESGDVDLPLVFE